MSAHTVTAYKRDLADLCEFLGAGAADGADFDPKSVTTNDLRAWMAHMSENGLSPVSIKRKMSSVRTFYRYLARRHGLDTNPTRGLRSIRAPRTLPAFIDSSQLNGVIDTAVDDADQCDDFTTLRDDLIVTMLYTTGLRASELVGLLDCDVDTRRCELKVLGKRNKERIVPFGDELSAMIDTYRKARRHATACSTTDTFFVREDGEPIYYRLVNRVVHAALDGNVTSQRRSPHALRHSFASDLLNNGADLNVVRKLLGHASLASTQIYTHVSYRDLQNNYKHAHPRAQKRSNHER